MELHEKGWVDNVSLDQENSEQIIKFLDAGMFCFILCPIFYKDIIKFFYKEF